MINKSNKDNILIGLTGDVMIGRYVNDFTASLPSAYIWGDFLPILQETDFNLINLEAALTTCENEVLKVFNFKADPKKVESLKIANIPVVNLANNHILDYFQEGLFETLLTLDSAHLSHVGAGKNLQAAQQPVILEKKGIHIGILGCTDNEPGWEANQDTAGTFYVSVSHPAPLEKLIKSLKSKIDFLILSMHWGPNMRQKPDRSFISFAHQMIEWGVDLFHGHSAHIFQGVEFYKQGLILYDTGDFVDDYAIDPFLRNDQSFLFIIECSKQGILALSLVPSVIENCQVNQAQGEEAEFICQKMKNLSTPFGTSFEEVNSILIWRC